MMRYGIPKYRLPRRVLDQEIARILDLGVKLELNTTVKDIEEEKKAHCYDAAFSQSVPAWLKTLHPGRRCKHMLDAVPFSAPWKAKKSLCSAVSCRLRRRQYRYRRRSFCQAYGC